ncbi:protein phosphatase 1 regulatory subunit 14b [Plakobranchus ocellatus]|uniref:Protein phosphatase 1 regulatory subunit 14b n=1 Tax=Plakobranchus ocellatus TaxID=259542 RepID=A0AAV4DXS8_9GAST|nr:protein phosphatase 1 regulatory subunit 14b [Plakobranchus ocellatus]
MSRNPFRKSVGFYEVMATSYTSDAPSDKSYGKPKQMENYPSSQSAEKDSPRNVGFNIKDQHSEKRKKYLTAKYGAHQMLLIKKRLGVEMWIFDELRKLYNSEVDDHDCELELEEILNLDTDSERREYALVDDHDCELELEEILNLDTDSERREYALGQLQDAKQSKDVVNNFIEEMLKKAKTL